MMKFVQFQVKKKLSNEMLKVTVELTSSVGLTVHPSLSTASARLARQKNLAEHQYQGHAQSARLVR